MFLCLLIPLFAFRIKFSESCSEEQFQCVSGSCIPKSKFCDFITDCQDGSDEDNCPVGNLITFENENLNGFYFGKPSSEGDLRWKIVGGFDSQRFLYHDALPFDHTFFNKSGHYILSMNNSDYGLEAWLISPLMRSTDSKTNCFIKFHYYLFGTVSPCRCALI